MDFSEISARFRKKREESAPPPAERNFAEIHALRARVLGVLLRDARLANNLSAAELASALGESEATILAWELGAQSPSLPQLELLAYRLNLPISHFFGTQMLERKQQRELTTPPHEYTLLRQRVIGIRLTLARREARLSLEELAKASGTDAETLSAYEFGQLPVPFPQLASLAMALRKSPSYFLEDVGQLGEWLALQEMYDRFCELPEEIRAFVAQPNSLPYLEIALRLSQLPLNELRAVGEKILDITL
ncbi:MAG: hypothetical protein CUN49_12640 [Candidatus Thermofonsia Clade 1 bacterium]|uniref:HTH cro/C1-type domain-containing protein n=1 Tax=Candidatus Thermofonsia Clade 1 bacterium TaxID=2364210 RepID=A0A2M8PBV9_9CHLR|nr:MAG: hypothetical protein CUN49_12640 [Candidatus Thermofonsia Clade 1 bacterium]